MSQVRNAASPERIAVGAVVQISDGAVQTSGVSIAVRGQGGASGAGAGTVAYDNGIVEYTPTQAETDFTSFIVIAYKTGCIPVSQTVITVPALQTGDTYALANGANGFAAIKSETASILADTGTDGVVVAAGSKTGYSLAADQSGVTVGTVNALGTTALADVNAEVDTALADYDAPTKAEMDSAFTEIKGATWATTDTLEAIRDRGDAAWTTATGFSTLDAAGVRTAVGLASANLDTQLSTIDTEIGVIDGIVDDLKSGIIYGAAATGTLSTTQATTNLTGYADDQLIGRVVIWLTGDCEGEATDITDYASTGGLLTFTALTTAPGNGDTFKIV